MRPVWLLVLGAFFSALNLYGQIEPPPPGSGFVGVSISDFGKVILITHAHEGYPARQHGIQPADILLRIDGEPAVSTANMIARIGKLPPGQKVKLSVLRGAEELDIVLELGKRPEENVLVDQEQTEAIRQKYSEWLEGEGEPVDQIQRHALDAMESTPDSDETLHLVALYRALAYAELPALAAEELGAARQRCERADGLLLLARLRRGLPRNDGIDRTLDDPARAQIATLVAQLADANYAVRERATAELVKLGQPALDALRAVVNSADLEQSQRATEIIAAIKEQAEAKQPEWEAVELEVRGVRDGEVEVAIHHGTLPHRNRVEYRALVVVAGQIQGDPRTVVRTRDDNTLSVSGDPLPIGARLVYLQLVARD